MLEVRKKYALGVTKTEFDTENWPQILVNFKQKLPQKSRHGVGVSFVCKREDTQAAGPQPK